MSLTYHVKLIDYCYLLVKLRYTSTLLYVIERLSL